MKTVVKQNTPSYNRITGNYFRLCVAF